MTLEEEVKEFEEYIEMIESDAKDLRECLTLFQAAKYQEVIDKAWSMDTNVRECIPEKMWNKCHKECAV